VIETNGTDHHKSLHHSPMSTQHQDDELKKLIAWFDERDPQAEAWLKAMADRVFIRASLEQLWKGGEPTHHRPEV